MHCALAFPRSPGGAERVEGDSLLLGRLPFGGVGRLAQAICSGLSRSPAGAALLTQPRVQASSASETTNPGSSPEEETSPEGTLSPSKLSSPVRTIGQFRAPRFSAIAVKSDSCCRLLAPPRTVLSDLCGPLLGNWERGEGERGEGDSLFLGRLPSSGLGRIAHALCIGLSQEPWRGGAGRRGQSSSRSSSLWWCRQARSSNVQWPFPGALQGRPS